MDAIMLALVAVALANADGRTGSFLADLLAVRSDRRAIAAAAFAAFVVNALIAALAGTIANRMIGQGVIALLAAFALLTAAAALLWRGRLTPPPADLVDASGLRLAAGMAISQLGDRSHFLIGALAATSGAGLWAAAGGFVGWILSLLPFMAFGAALADARAARLVRWGAAAILAGWGARSAMGAFGL